MHVTRVPSTTMLPRLALVAGVALAGSLLAPMALHWSTNGLGYLFAYAVWNA